ncbi:hypothetical protein QQP08_006960, partial [Theobroma cacao]
GFFEILDIDTLQGITEEIRFCEGFSAHPAATANPKAYEFTKQIAGLMQFKLYPRSDVWHEIFKTDIADPNNVALYFYPSGIESSKRKYSTLLKYMVKNDMVMKSRMGSVELMVLTSKLLPSDFQKMRGSFFMWGTFRVLRADYEQSSIIALSPDGQMLWHSMI